MENIKNLIKKGKDFEAFQELTLLNPEMKLKEADKLLKRLQADSLTLEKLGIENISKKSKTFNEKEFGIDLTKSEEEKGEEE